LRRLGTKAGGSAAPVTLRLGADDPRGRVAGDQIEEFARQVRQLSGGALRIEPVWRAVGEGSAVD
jgi:TRAP-type C4-dicarboxylate transport system substrate-binding protein